MQHIDSEKLYADGEYRFEFVSKFMDFGKFFFNCVFGRVEYGINLCIH